MSRRPTPKELYRDRLVVLKRPCRSRGVRHTCGQRLFPHAWLDTLNEGGTNLPCHCDMNKTPGVDFTTGSLGQGSSAAVGIALGQKLLGQKAEYVPDHR